MSLASPARLRLSPPLRLKLDANTIAQHSAFMTQQYGPSRRAVLLGLAACSALRPTISNARSLCDEPASDNANFSPTGPRAEAFGIKEGFPVADPLLLGQPGEPLDMKYRVGAFSHFDEQYRIRNDHLDGEAQVRYVPIVALQQRPMCA